MVDRRRRAAEAHHVGMGAERQIRVLARPSRERGLERRAGELRLARYQRTREPADRDALVELYMPLARSLAARYRHTGESFDDLSQVASLGLLKAIDRYDPCRQSAFASFAVPTILGELRRHLRDHTWMVHVPRGVQELSQRLRTATEELTGRIGRPPIVAELARHLRVGEEEVLDARAALAAHSPRSLDEPISDNSEPEPATLGDLVSGGDGGMELAEGAVLVEHYLAQLPPRNREVLRLRFEEDLKQREIAALLGISQMHVSRLIRQSLERLQAAAADESAVAAAPPARSSRAPHQAAGASSSGRAAAARAGEVTRSRSFP
jgi:RNA polymerase sigma-B factor